jgi:hypothetical protein
MAKGPRSLLSWYMITASKRDAVHTPNLVQGCVIELVDQTCLNGFRLPSCPVESVAAAVLDLDSSRRFAWFSTYRSQGSAKTLQHTLSRSGRRRSSRRRCIHKGGARHHRVKPHQCRAHRLCPACLICGPSLDLEHVYSRRGHRCTSNRMSRGRTRADTVVNRRTEHRVVTALTAAMRTSNSFRPGSSRALLTISDIDAQRKASALSWCLMNR